MPEYSRLTAKEAEKLLLRSGFVLDRQKGSHRIYIKKTDLYQENLSNGFAQSCRRNITPKNHQTAF